MRDERDFLKPETRCDFYVSEKRKKVWKVELDILEDFIGICQRHNLKYFLFAGSLLGAARHQGIIPWDDDIDVAMPREDYEQFLKIAPEELQQQHVLVSPNNEREYFLLFSKICNKNTAAMETYFWKNGYSHPQGIFLDIFPYDCVPNSKIARKTHQAQIKIGKIILLLNKGYHIDENKHRKLSSASFKMAQRIISRLSMHKLLASHYRVSTKYNKRKTGTISYITMGYDPKLFCLSEWAEDLVDVPFEHLRVRIPKQYDLILTNHFGNWHEFVKGTSCHNGIFFDPDRPYTEYLGRYEEFKDASREL